MILDPNLDVHTNHKVYLLCDLNSCISLPPFGVASRCHFTDSALNGLCSRRGKLAACDNNIAAALLRNMLVVSTAPCLIFASAHGLPYLQC